MRQEKRKLTREQGEMRLTGLRILARTIAPARLGLLTEEEAVGSRPSGVRAHLGRRPLGKDGGHVR